MKAVNIVNAIYINYQYTDIKERDEHLIQMNKNGWVNYVSSIDPLLVAYNKEVFQKL